MTSGNTVRIDFHSSLGMLDFVQMISEYIARTVGLDDDSVHWVTVAVRESVINAIKHGNCNDIRKRVHVEFTALQDRDGSGIAILVRDEGCGFDPTSLPDPLAAENLLIAVRPSEPDEIVAREEALLDLDFHLRDPLALVLVDLFLRRAERLGQILRGHVHGHA